MPTMTIDEAIAATVAEQPSTALEAMRLAEDAIKRATAPRIGRSNNEAALAVRARQALADYADKKSFRDLPKQVAVQLLARAFTGSRAAAYSAAEKQISGATCNG